MAYHTVMASGPASVVLGLSAGYHDAAAALLVDGDLVAAVEQERLSRVKHDASFPARAADTCLRIAGLNATDVGAIAFHEKPVAVLARHVATRLRRGPLSPPQLFRESPRVARKQLAVPFELRRWCSERGTSRVPTLFAEHHVSHAAAAYYPSPFDAAAILTVDGVGEWATTTLGRGRHHHLDVDRELRFPNSIGLLYSGFTAYCGFRVNGGEGELMGLAPFGQPRYADRIREALVCLRDDGSVELDQRYFGSLDGRTSTTARFHRLFDGPPRPLGSVPGQREADLASSIQVVLEEVLLRLAQELHRSSGETKLCVAGGVALNCVANARLASESPFSEVWVQPAAGDAGNAVGAAFWAWHSVMGAARPSRSGDAMHGGFLGPSFSDAEVERWLVQERIGHRRFERPELLDGVAAALAAGEVVGWFQGQMEFGPRALGHRSILADPRSPTVQRRLNSMVKERAAFRPFAPAVLEDHAGAWFEGHSATPYMTSVLQLKPERRVAVEAPADDLTDRVAQVRSVIPAVTHVDHSARVQLVSTDRNPEFAALLEAFERRTGCPVLLNTSFNRRDEPIVCTPADAYETFRHAGLDRLVIGAYMIGAA